jgi:spermidine synthase
MHINRYGEWKTVRRFLLAYCKFDFSILLIGNGNSNIAADMHDAGYKSLLAIDFSDVVIKEMEKKNKHRSPALKFELMDMLNMSYENASLDIVFDKATMDALMADDGPESNRDADKLLSEVDRVLKSGGRYICITLLQSHILNKLVGWFTSRGGWKVVIHQILSPQESDSPLCPFFLVATKDASMVPSAPVTLKLLASNAQDATRGARPAVGTSSQLPPLEVIAAITDTQVSFSMLHKLAALRPGELTSLDLWGDADTNKSSGARFKVVAVDSTVKTKSSHEKSKCGVLIVPIGREHEWMFSNEDGLLQLVNDSGYARLIVVTMNRGHTFDTLTAVQGELSPFMTSLCPKNVEIPIPFLTVSVDIGYRNIRSQGQSSLSGDLIVEDVKSGSNDSECWRRLFFLSNPHAVQSEAKVIDGVVDHSYLCFDHHHAMMSALGLMSKAALQSPHLEVVVVGLGGGALPMFIHDHFTNTTVTSIELDPVVADLAKADFGMVESPRSVIQVADGVKYIETLNVPANIIMVDADSKDLSTGMSFPPPSFLTKEFLLIVKGKLAPDGILVMNVSSRNKELYSETIARMSECFGKVYELSVEDQNNTIVAVSPSSFPEPYAPLAQWDIIKRLAAKEWHGDVDIRSYLFAWK